MNSRAVKRTVVGLLASAGILSVASQVLADAQVVRGPSYYYAYVSAQAVDGTCLPGSCLSGYCSDPFIGPAGACCRFRVCNTPVGVSTVDATPVTGTNRVYASARALAPPLEMSTRIDIRGTGTGGPGAEAIGDTTVTDSMAVTFAPSGPTQVQVVMNGLLRVQSPPNRASMTTRKLIVYPDTTAAKADPAGAGFGSLFMGTIVVTSSAGSLPVAAFSGGFSPGNFVVDVSPGNTLNIRANNVTKVVAMAVPANATVRLTSDSRTQPTSAVPGPSPIGLALLALLLVGAGTVAFRRHSTPSA